MIRSIVRWARRSSSRSSSDGPHVTTRNVIPVPISCSLGSPRQRAPAPETRHDHPVPVFRVGVPLPSQHLPSLCRDYRKDNHMTKHPENYRPLDASDFRAVRSYLADEVFFTVPGGGAAPNDVIDEDTWDGMMHLPTDVLLRTTDYQGRMVVAHTYKGPPGCTQRQGSQPTPFSCSSRPQTLGTSSTQPRSLPRTGGTGKQPLRSETPWRRWPALLPSRCATTQLGMRTGVRASMNQSSGTLSTCSDEMRCSATWTAGLGHQAFSAQPQRGLGRDVRKPMSVCAQPPREHQRRHLAKQRPCLGRSGVSGNSGLTTATPSPSASCS